MFAIKRVVIPIMWVLCLSMFFLPWTSIRCDGGKELRELSGGSGSVIEIARQNGFQVLTGGHTLTKDGELVAKRDTEKSATVSCGPAYVLWFYLLGMLACIIGGIAAIGNDPKEGDVNGRWIGDSCLRLAIVDGPSREESGIPEQVDPGLRRADNAAAKPKGAFTIYSFGFYGAWLFAAIAAALTCLELLGDSRKPPPGLARRPSVEDRAEGDDDERRRSDRAAKSIRRNRKLRKAVRLGKAAGLFRS